MSRHEIVVDAPDDMTTAKVIDLIQEAVCTACAVCHDSVKASMDTDEAEEWSDTEMALGSIRVSRAANLYSVIHRHKDYGEGGESMYLLRSSRSVDMLPSDTLLAEAMDIDYEPVKGEELYVERVSDIRELN